MQICLPINNEQIKLPTDWILKIKPIIIYEIPFSNAIYGKKGAMDEFVAFIINWLRKIIMSITFIIFFIKCDKHRKNIYIVEFLYLFKKIK